MKVDQIKTITVCILYSPLGCKLFQASQNWRPRAWSSFCLFMFFPGREGLFTCLTTTTKLRCKSGDTLICCDLLLNSRSKRLKSKYYCSPCTACHRPIKNRLTLLTRDWKILNWSMEIAAICLKVSFSRFTFILPIFSAIFCVDKCSLRFLWETECMI